MWRHLKEHVYDSNPHTIQDLKMNTSEATASKNQRSLRRVAQNKVKWVNACIQENGGHFQHILQTTISGFIVLYFTYFVLL
jgi:hypothetical protein